MEKICGKVKAVQNKNLTHLQPEASGGCLENLLSSDKQTVKKGKYPPESGYFPGLD